MKQLLFLDMDGTIDDLYGVNGWLEYINAEDVTPYLEAEPIVDYKFIDILLDKFDVYVVTMTPPNSRPEFDIQVGIAKHRWIKEHFQRLDERLIVIRHNDNKNLREDTVVVYKTCDTLPIPDENSAIIDDNEKFRNSFVGTTKYDENMQKR